MEQATLLLEALAQVRHRGGGIHVVVNQVHQILLAENRAGLAQARPLEILHTGNDNTAKLPAHRTVRGQQRHCVRRGRSAIAHTGGQFLLQHAVHEQLEPTLGFTLGEVTGGVE